MPPTKVEAVRGNGWTFTTIAAALFCGACYFAFRAWTLPVPLTEQLTVTGIASCAGLSLPFGVRHIRLARRQARRRAEILATGLRTTATVTAVTQTRTGGEGHDPTVRITLRVTTPDGGTRSAWASYELPIPIIVDLRRGSLIPVILDVDDPLSVIIDWNNHDNAAEPDIPEVINLLERGDVALAVKAYKDLTGAGLVEARDAVDRIATRHGL